MNLANGQFAKDADHVLARARDAGVAAIVLTGTDLDASRRCLIYCEQQTPQNPLLYCTAGVHPHDASTWSATTRTDLEALAASPWVRAIGETGLDFNRNYSTVSEQELAFSEQIDLATQLDLPLFVHDRESGGRVLTLLQSQNADKVVIHCFTGTEQELRAYLEAGYYIGITGWITDKRRGATLRDLAELIPDDRLLLETDAPFLLPHNAPQEVVLSLTGETKWKRRNEPALLSYVTECVAEARGQTVDHVALCAMQNATRFFSL